MSDSEHQNPIPAGETQTPEQRIQALEERAQKAEAESVEYKQRLVFVDIENPETKEALERLIEQLAAFCYEIGQVQDFTRKLTYAQSLSAYPEVRNIVQVVETFNAMPAALLKLSLEKAQKTGILTGTWLGRFKEGRVNNTEDLEYGVSMNVYNDSIYRSYDQVLIALESLNHLELLVKLDPESSKKYREILPQVQEHLKKANEALTHLGVEPLKLSFFTRADDRPAQVDDSLVKYVRYTSDRPDFRDYARNPEVAGLPREVVFSARSWAYFKKGGRDLWQNHRAEVIVSP
jgi:hypothetical protein